MANMLNENFELLKQLFTDCLNAKNNIKDTKVDLDEKLKIGSLEFVVIKKINRLVKYKVRSGREELQAQKTLVDCNRLHLQNLLYEVNYLKREIKHCYRFKSQDEDIDIYEQRIDSVPESKLSHKDRIERLERELNLRKKLSDDCNKLLNDKNMVFNQIIVKMENLSTFAPSLRTLLKATRPLQEALQMPIEQKWKLEQKVHMLPEPLYLAYVNLRAIEQLEGGFDLVVLGQEDELKTYEMKKNETSSLQDQSFFLQPHPLSLQIKFTDACFANDYIAVKVYYLPLLEIVTGYCEIYLNENQINHSESNVLQDFLKFIGEDDMGDSLPYSTATLNLQNHNITLDEFYKKLAKNNLGKPYRWLQHLCGNTSFNSVKNDHNKILKLKDFTSDCVKKLKSYWNSRLILITQIRSFMNKTLDEYIDTKLGCTKPNCALVQWSAISWEEYEGSETTLQLINQKLADETCSFFRAVIVLSSAKMECLISISNKYPLNIPLWTITVHWNGHHNALNNSSIKIMEQYTNSLNDSKPPSLNLLAKQLLRTMYSFDIFLETEGPLYQPLEYNKEKSFIKSFSKRIRVRPYKKITKGSINYFKQ
ncbi:THO complex subunit 5 [Lucilia cuprina]|uniref:THO complex subunit 5 n=1 Tax=Lucilia cuprina TaxID=7375 RepID=A0A0L0CIP9_LUCCU|nr:THO complex subunit 5 [Lucilia cuprina]